MGVWIETDEKTFMGKKLVVTPCVGVWIETNKHIKTTHYIKVTPCVGVWIETYNARIVKILHESHPAWVCGLKHPNNDSYVSIRGHTLRGCVD